MKKKFNIWYSGLWTYPIVSLVLYELLVQLATYNIVINAQVRLIIVFILPLLIPIFIWRANRSRAKNGVDTFDMATTFGLKDGRSVSRAKLEAAYPIVDEKYISDRPEGLVLGQQDEKYVRVAMGRDGINFYGIGAPGAGKSVLLLGFLYSNLYAHKFNRRTSSLFNFFLIDIKGELYESLLKIDGRYRAADNHLIHVVQPCNRESYGWDVFYRIHKPGVTTTEKLKAITDIAEALVEANGDNPYFYLNARKIMTGVLFFYIEKGLDFIPIVQKITRSNMGELLKEIVEAAELEGQGIVLDKLKSFVGKEGNESCQDIEATMRTSLECFSSYPDVIYSLRDNPYKTSPAALNDGISNIDLAIEEGMLTTYQPLFRLITMQILKHAESDFKASDNRKTAIIVDEAARCGQLEGLDSAMATLRSRHTSLLLFFQDMSQFRDIYKKDKADSILNICEVKLFLSGAGDKQTTDYVANMAGMYDEETISYSKALLGKKDVKYDIERRSIVEGADLMNLREKDELIAVIYGRYYRFQKFKYHKDQYLAPIAEAIKAFNAEHMVQL